MPVDDRLIRIANWEMADAAAAIPDLMVVEDRPTAIFATSDDMALGALERLCALGYHVPEDVAIVGFDGIPLAQEIIPPLTTVRVPFGELGRRAADLLLRRANGGDEAKLDVLPVELIHPFGV